MISTPFLTKQTEKVKESHLFFLSFYDIPMYMIMEF